MLSAHSLPSLLSLLCAGTWAPLPGLAGPADQGHAALLAGQGQPGVSAHLLLLRRLELARAEDRYSAVGPLLLSVYIQINSIQQYLFNVLSVLQAFNKDSSNLCLVLG